MSDRSKKSAGIYMAVLIAGLIIFICGFILFIIDPKDSSSYLYSVIMCVVGVVLVLFSMIFDLRRRSKNKKEAANLQNKD